MLLIKTKINILQECQTTKIIFNHFHACVVQRVMNKFIIIDISFEKYKNYTSLNMGNLI